MLAGIWWMAFPIFAADARKSEHQPIVPNPTIQSFLKTLVSTNEQQALGGTEESVREKFEQLRKMAGQDKDLVLQLLYFDTHAGTERARWLTMAVVKELAISGDTFAEVGLSLLDAEDEATRKQAFGCLTRADRNSKGDIDFGRYEGILREKKQNPPQGLIRYMYDRNSQAALFSMSRVYGDKGAETELADQLKGDPKAALQSLADRPEWWAHLYVTETMQKNPQLRDPVILKKLETDEHPLVRETLAKMKSGQGQSK